MSATPKDLDNTLTKLSLSPTPPKSTFAAGKKQPIVDSWEDEEDSGEETDRPITPQTSTSYPSAPPPTPSSPSYATNAFEHPFGYNSEDTASPRERAERTARPDKTDAVAKRLIAGALGVKPPKKTEEQRAYDRAMKEKEMKRRNAEKEDLAKAKEQAEKAKAAVWED